MFNPRLGCLPCLQFHYYFLQIRLRIWNHWNQNLWNHVSNVNPWSIYKHILLIFQVGVRWLALLRWTVFLWLLWGLLFDNFLDMNLNHVFSGRSIAEKKEREKILKLILYDTSNILRVWWCLSICESKSALLANSFPQIVHGNYV